MLHIHGNLGGYALKILMWISGHDLREIQMSALG